MVWPELLTDQDKIVFSDDEEDEFFDNNYFRRALLKDILELRDSKKCKEFWAQIPNFDLMDYSIYQNFALEMVETFGVTNYAVSFEFLSKFQHGLHSKCLLEELKLEAGTKYELGLMQQLRQRCYSECNRRLNPVEDFLDKG